MLEKQNTKRQLKTILHLDQYFVIFAGINNVNQNKPEFAMPIQKYLEISRDTAGMTNQTRLSTIDKWPKEQNYCFFFFLDFHRVMY